MEHHSVTLTIDGKDYVAIPASEYRRLMAHKPVTEAQDGIAWARATLGENLKRAREHAGLTQGALAKRLKRSQTMVARAESGDMRVSERYVKGVLKACRLPADWTPESDT